MRNFNKKIFFSVLTNLLKIFEVLFILILFLLLALFLMSIDWLNVGEYLDLMNEGFF